MKALDFLKCMRKDTPCEWDELDEAIAELEEMQQPKSCSICRSFKTCSVPRVVKDELNVEYFYCNDFEPKEQ